LRSINELGSWKREAGGFVSGKIHAQSSNQVEIKRLRTIHELGSWKREAGGFVSEKFTLSRPIE